MTQGVSATVIPAREELLMLKLLPNMLIVMSPDCGILAGKKPVTLTTCKKCKLNA